MEQPDDLSEQKTDDEGQDSLRRFLREHEVACQIRMQWECRVGAGLERLIAHLIVIEEAMRAGR